MTARKPRTKATPKKAADMEPFGVLAHEITDLFLGHQHTDILLALQIVAAHAIYRMAEDKGAGLRGLEGSFIDHLSLLIGSLPHEDGYHFDMINDAMPSTAKH